MRIQEKLLGVHGVHTADDTNPVLRTHNKEYTIVPIV